MIEKNDGFEEVELMLIELGDNQVRFDAVLSEVEMCDV